ncbi:MAG TPA: hypothetical protein VGB50_09895 [Flavobacterium sp.]|jgi:hypothetical protein
MRIIKNIFAGFAISFIGSLPLGYLNLAGYGIYLKSGLQALLYYLAGVIIIEAIIIWCTLIFAEKIARNQYMLKAIEVFSIIFLLLLGVLFSMSPNANNYQSLLSIVTYTSFGAGLLLSCLNFMQIPFWTGWNLYLIGSRYIISGRYFNLIYLFGAVAGTLAGMLSFIFILNATSGRFSSELIMQRLIPLVFFSMAAFQMFQLYRKHYVSRKRKK